MRLPGVLTRHFAGREAAFGPAGLPCGCGNRKGFQSFGMERRTMDEGVAETGAATGGVRLLLRLEGLTLFIGLTLLYAAWGGSWTLYLLLFLVPDLSFLAYLSSARFGAMVYNAAHSYLAPVTLMTLGFGFASPLTLSIALIWLA